jgi:hypothetical protein
MFTVWLVTGSVRGLVCGIAEAVLAFRNQLVATVRTTLTGKIIRGLPRTRLVTGEAHFLTVMASTAIVVMFSAPVMYTLAADTPLLEPRNLIVDRSLPREQADAQIWSSSRNCRTSGSLEADASRDPRHPLRN